MRDLIDREVTIDAFHKFSSDGDFVDACEYVLRNVPSAQPDGKIMLDKEAILQAGYQGREVDFRIGGRLFAIREKAQ